LADTTESFISLTVYELSMTEEKQRVITDLVNDSLDKAEAVWEEVGTELLRNKAAQFSNESIQASMPTLIPGHEFIEEGKPLVDEFIALVLDMRDSSKHLNFAIADTDASQLKRVFYETAALLPACSQLIADQEGGVTEYLGDGLLAFFAVDEKDKGDACYKSHHAASGCMNAVSKVINPILYERYRLPPLAIGIGMSVSKAVLTITGQANFLKPVAFGQCVFHATKLSKGRGEIVVDEALQLLWPKSKTGRISFRACKMNDIAGYVIQTSK